jgi:hypothetical protein
MRAIIAIDSARKVLSFDRRSDMMKNLVNKISYIYWWVRYRPDMPLLMWMRMLRDTE